MSEYRSKIQDEYLYHGAGYEVVLHHVPMLEVGNEWVFNINMNIIDGLILDELPHQPWPLTGNQLRFIRDFADMTYQAFATRFGVSHPAVKKWENAGDGPTNMSWSTEKDIRLFVLMQTNTDTTAFQKCYTELIDIPDGKPEPIHIDVETMAVS